MGLTEPHKNDKRYARPIKKASSRAQVKSCKSLSSDRRSMGKPGEMIAATSREKGSLRPQLVITISRC